MGLAQCPIESWHALEKGSWTEVLPTFKTQYLDIRMLRPHQLDVSLAISVQEGTAEIIRFPHTLVFCFIALSRSTMSFTTIAPFFFLLSVCSFVLQRNVKMWRDAWSSNSHCMMDHVCFSFLGCRAVALPTHVSSIRNDTFYNSTKSWCLVTFLLRQCHDSQSDLCCSDPA